MLMRRYTYVDVYYNENEAEIKKALRERERLIVGGYELMAGDTAEKKASTRRETLPRLGVGWCATRWHKRSQSRKLSGS